MAISTTLTTRGALARIVKSLKDFAKAQHWKPGEYAILFRVLEDWGRISFILVAEDLGGKSNREVWNELFDHLEKTLNRGADVGFSLGFSVRERKQVEEGGMYSIPEGYVDASDLLPGTSLTD
jgi:hypothetical protein